MQKRIVLAVTLLVMLAGCSNEKKPSAANFIKAINQYLAKQGQECTFFAQTFPIDIPVSELKNRSGAAPQMAALQQAALVHGSNMTAVLHGMMGALAHRHHDP